jgi:hypothetical protein
MRYQVLRYRMGIASMIALTLFVCCGQTAPQTCAQPQPAPSKAPEIVGFTLLAGVAVGTIVLIEVHHSHHTVKGCVFTAAQNGLEVLNSSDQKTYTLVGVTPNIKVGDIVSLHGSKAKQKKNSTGDQTFVVEKINKDYGPCKVPTVTPPAPTTP